MVDTVYRTWSLGLDAEGLPDQYADGRAARVWQLHIGDTRGRTAEYPSWLLALLRQHRCRSVLDVACGTGVDSIMLLEEGFQVTSVDASDKMLKYALKERWERRKEEPFDRWGAGAVGAGKGLRTLTFYPSALSMAPRSAQATHLGGLAAGDLPVPAARQRQAMVPACLAAGQRPEQAHTGAWEGLGDAGVGSCRQGRLLGVPALTHFRVLQSLKRPTGSHWRSQGMGLMQSLKRPTGSHWRRTWRSQGMGLMQSSASGTPLRTCLTSKGTSDHKLALRNIASMVRPGGVLVIDHRNYNHSLATGCAPPGKNIYYKSNLTKDITTSVLLVNKAHMVTLDYTVQVPPTEAEADPELSKFHLSYYPHRLEAFTALLKGAFQGKCQHSVLGNFQPYTPGQAHVPCYFIHILKTG